MLFLFVCFFAFFLFIKRLWCSRCPSGIMVESLITQEAFQLYFWLHVSDRTDALYFNYEAVYTVSFH